MILSTLFFVQFLSNAHNPSLVSTKIALNLKLPQRNDGCHTLVRYVFECGHGHPLA